MSDKQSIRLKRLCDNTKKPKDRFFVLPSLAQEGFSGAEIQEFYSKNDQLILMVYLEYMKSLDAEAENPKGPKFLTASDLGPICHVFKTLLAINRQKIASGWELATIEAEVLSFLHVDNSNMVRRLGLDLLIHLTDALHRQPTEADFEQCVFERARILTVISSFDWEQFRAGMDVTLPSTIVEIRQKRHKAFPLRSRSTLAVDEEREREATDALKLLYDHILSLEGPKLRNWWLVFRNHLAPISYPTECFSSGAIVDQRWDGFSHGASPSFHRLTVQFLHAILQTKGLPTLTILASEIDTKFTTTVALSSLHISPIDDRKTLSTAFHLLQAWIEAPPQHWKATINEPVFSALGTNDIRRGFQWLCEATTGTGPFSTPESDTTVLCQLMLQTEREIQYLRSVVLNQHDAFTLATRSTAQKHLASLCFAGYGVLADFRDSPTANLSPIKDVLVFAAQCFWDASFSLCPPGSKAFETEVLTLCRSVGPLVKANFKSSYFHNCWMGLLFAITENVVFVNAVPAPPRRSFTWPTTQLLTESPSAELLHYRSGRTATPYISVFLEKLCPNPKAAYAALSNGIHTAGADLTSDVFSVRVAKGWTICKCVKHLLSSVLTENITIEPNSVLSMVAPYLVIVSQPHETESSPFSTVILETLEVMALVVSAPSAVEIRPELYMAVMNTLTSALETATSKVIEVNQHETEPALERRGSVLNIPVPPPQDDALAPERPLSPAPSPRPSSEQLPEVHLVVRVLNALFPGNSTRTHGTPTVSCFSAGHRWINVFRSSIYAAADAILGLSVTAFPDVTLLLEAKVAALTAKTWEWMLIWRLEMEQAARLGALSKIVESLESAVKLRYPHTHLVRTITVLLTTTLGVAQVKGNSAPTDSASADFVPLIGRLLRLLEVEWVQLSEKTALQLYGAHLAISEAFVSQLPHNSFIQEYSRHLTSLIAAAFLHLSAWKVTKQSGESILYLLRAIGDCAVRVGYLHATSAVENPNPANPVPLIQILADLISFAQSGRTTLRYLIKHLKESGTSNGAKAGGVGLEVVTVGTDDDALEDGLVIPSMDRKPWFGTVANLVGNAKEYPSPLDVGRTACSIHEQLLYFSSVQPVQEYPIHYPLTPLNPSSSTNEGRPQPQYFALNRSALGVVVSEQRDSFEFQHVDECGELRWTAEAIYGKQVRAKPPQSPEAGGSNGRRFTVKAPITNNTLTAILEDFPSMQVVPRELMIGTEGEVETRQSNEAKEKRLLNFQPLQPLTRPTTSLASNSRDFWNSLGMLGIGEVASRAKPFSGAMKPPLWFNHQDPKTFLQSRDVHPATTHHVAISRAPSPGDETGLAVFQRQILSILGWPLKEEDHQQSPPDGILEYTLPGQEIQTTIVDGLHQVPMLNIPIHIVCVSSFAALTAVRKGLLSRPQGKAPCAVVFLMPVKKRMLPAAAPGQGEMAAEDHSVVAVEECLVFLQLITNVPLTALIDGLAYPICGLGPILHAVVRIANESFLRLRPETMPTTERREILSETKLGLTDISTFEGFLLPFFTGVVNVSLAGPPAPSTAATLGSPSPMIAVSSGEVSPPMSGDGDRSPPSSQILNPN